MVFPTIKVILTLIKIMEYLLRERKCQVEVEEDEEKLSSYAHDEEYTYHLS